MGVCNCSMFCCTLLYFHSSIAIILMGKRELIALLNLSSWCLMMVEQLFLAMPRGCLQFVIVVFPDHTHLLFLINDVKMFPAVYRRIYCLKFLTLSNQNNYDAKIRNRYNQVPHLSQDTNGKVPNSQKTPQTRAKRSALSQQVTTKHI